MKKSLLLVVLLASGCGSPERAPESRRAARAVVDSALSAEESLRRLRVGLAEPAGLQDGESTRDRLVRALVHALERGDTGRAVSLHVTRAEFAWLYYPTAAAPGGGDQMDPAMMWLLLRLESEKGLDRMFSRTGGQRLGYEGHRCEPEPRVEGPNRLWEHCRVELGTPPVGFRANRLFGTILERDGRFKFLSFKTDL